MVQGTLQLPALVSALRELVKLAYALEGSPPSPEECDVEGNSRVVRARRILQASAEVLSKLLAHFDAEAETETEERAEQYGPFAARSVADHCFVAHMELAHVAAGLELTGDRGNTWDVVAQCNHALGVFIKAGVSIEQVVCRRAGERAELDTFTDACQAVALRAAFVQLGQAVTRDRAPEPEELEDRLRAAGAAIEDLFASDAGPSIRLSDRRQLLKLQKRTSEWLEKAGREATDGMHLWQDIHGLCELLMQINHREELLEHDTRLVGRVLEDLTDPEHPADPVELIDRLYPLKGRDADLDGFIDSKSVSATGALRKVLTRLKKELQPRGKPAPSETQVGELTP